MLCSTPDPLSGLIITIMVNGSVEQHRKKKAHKVDLGNFVNADKCKQGKTWHKHYQVQSWVQQHRGGKWRLRPQATLTHQEPSSHADAPVKVARCRGQSQQLQLEFTSNLARRHR